MNPRGLARVARQHAELLWAPALYATVVLVLYREVWLGLGGVQHWFGWDTLEMHWPDLSYLAGSLRHGHAPLWNPFDRGGYPFYGDTQTTLYSPLTWLFVAAGAIPRSLPGALAQAQVLTMLAIAGLGMHGYLRSRTLGPAAAAFGGLVWIASAPMIIHKAAPVIWPMIWAPLCWIAIDRLIERADRPGLWRRAALLAGALYLSGSAGPPQGFFFVLLASVPYGGFRAGVRLIDARTTGRLRPELTRLALGLAIAAAATLALLAIIVIPATRVLALSPRAHRSLGYNLGNALPIGPALRGLVCPPLGMVDAYAGVVTLALAVTALVVRPRSDRGAPIMWAVLAVVAGMLMLGTATPLLRLAVLHLPGFNLFREPNRYKLLAELCLVPVAAHGFDAVVELDRARRRRALIAALGAAALLACAWLVMRIAAHHVAPAAKHPLTPGPAGTLLVLGLATALLVALGWARGHLRLILAGGLIAVAYFDVTGFAQNFVRVTERPVDDQADRRFLVGLGDVEREWRIYDEFVMEQRPGSRLRVRDFRGYPSGDPFEFRRYDDVLRRLEHNPELLEAFNVKWVLHGPHHRSRFGSAHLKRPPTAQAPDHFRSRGGHLFEALHPAPAVAWYGAVTLADSPHQALDRLVAETDASGPRTSAVVEHADVPADLAGPLDQLAHAPGAVPFVAGRVASLIPDQVVAEVNAPARGLVVSNEVDFAGWKVTVDGRPATPVRADYLLRGVVVGPGHHQIIWHFAPPGYRWLLALYLGGLLLLLAAALPRRVAALPLRWRYRNHPASGAAGSATGQPEV